MGIDPGTRQMGVGVIDVQGSQYHCVHYEVIQPSPKLAIEKRLYQIHLSLREVLRTQLPEIIALESVFYSKDVKATVKIGEARACAMLAASEQGLNVVEYPPARVKQAVSGNGRATKHQMQQMVKTLLSLKEAPPTDAADALAIGICHAHYGGKSLQLK